jgi:Ca2+/Na+ antiporter
VFMVARVAMAALAALAAAMPTVTITVMATAKGVEHGCLGFQLLSSALACIGPIKPIASRLSL